MKRFLASLGLLVLALFFYLFLFAELPPAIQVTIINVSDEPLKDVFVRGGGARYSLGDIPAGGRVKKGFDITQDSNMGVSHEGQGFPVHVYLTRGYSGEVTLELDQDSVEKTFDSVN